MSRVKAVSKKSPDCLQDTVATAEALFSLGQCEAQAIGNGISEPARVEFARGLCAAVLASLWKRKVAASGCHWELRQAILKPNRQFPGLVDRLAGALAKLSHPRAGFLAGQLYTAMLPDAVRKTLGAYYTPPPLVDRLVDLVSRAGFDWSTGRIIDPASGGAAFLASVAPKLVEASSRKPALAIVEAVENQLLGIEVDPFAAWMSMVLLDITLLDLTVKAGRPLRPLVHARDALDLSADTLGQFDLVIGNPPYGKITLPSRQRERFKQSLFGHANLYGLFTELAVRLTREGGLIAYVTPTSFLGGEYFKNLRRMLRQLAPVQQIEFISDREGVFAGVLQETMLAVFSRQSAQKQTLVRVNLLQVNEATEPIKAEAIGRITLSGADGSPWVLPRSQAQVDLVRQFNAMPLRLSDYGFAVSTGQLVWNRHKRQLRASYEPECYPIIWAEAVNPDGSFHFQAARATHLPYLKIEPDQEFLINQEPCILVQRTTAKEQKRRLIAALIPNSFVVEYPGFIVENHLNMIYSRTVKPKVALRTITVLLSSAVLDQAFRCINGSVAVSAYELNSLPLPNPNQMRQLQEAILSRTPTVEIDELIAGFYGTSHEWNRTLASPRCGPPGFRLAVDTAAPSATIGL